MEFSTHLKSDEVEIERRIREFLLGSDPIVIRYLDSIAGQHGKRLRPKLVMVFARLFGEYDYGRCITCACAAELLHTATLVHDDVIDTAEMRRGHVTLSNRFGNEVAVIVGDYLLAIVLDRVSKLRDFAVLDMFVDTSKRLGVGVLAEIGERNNFKLSAESYMRVIELKTGVLFELCSRLGAYLGGAEEDAIKQAARYGRAFGMAFQIVDDLLDIVADVEKTGKPVFNDLKEGRITLPIIHALGLDDKIRPVLDDWQKNPSPEASAGLRTMLCDLGSLTYARERAEEYLALAKKEFAQIGGPLRLKPALADLSLIESGLFSIIDKTGAWTSGARADQSARLSEPWK